MESRCVRSWSRKTPDEVWEALTEPERLEEWFASEVELDARPGGEGVFRWGDGDERHAVVRELEEAERLVLDWDDGGSVAIELEPVEAGTRVRVVESSPQFATGVRAARRGVDGSRGGVDRVFAALGDAGRRSLVEAVAARGTATATELAAELPVTRQAVAKQLSALADAGLLRATRSGRETRYEVTPAPLRTPSSGWSPSARRGTNGCALALTQRREASGCPA